MITLRQNPNEPTLYIGSEQGGGKLPAFAPESSPRLVSSTPADNSGAISTSPTIRLTFDSPVALGSGSFFISDGATQSYIDPATGMPDVRIVGAKHILQVPASSASVGGGGYYVEFTAPATLKGGVNYFVFFKPGPVVGAGNGLPYAGLSDSTMLNFVTSSDATAPTALSAKTTNAAGAYKAGDLITITVAFSEFVTVIGNPRLELNVGSGKYATLSGPSSGTSLTFSYTVQAGDTAAELAFNDLNDLATGITDGNGNPLTLANIAFSELDASTSTGNGSELVIDTSAPTAGAWNVTEGATDVPHGSTLSLTFSENIVVTNAGSTVFVSLDGAPAAALPFTDPSISISGSTLYLAGLAANTSYQVTLSPGAVSDLAGNPVAGSPQIFFATSATALALDTIAPGVLDVTAAAGAAPTEYNIGNTISIQVTMSEDVNVAGVPLLRLQLDNGTADAAYTGKTGKVLSFSYTVAAGDNAASLAYAGTGALILDGGAAITDIKGNPAVLTLPAPGAAHSLDANTAIEIDTVPIVTAAAPTSGSGGVALDNNLVLTFSEAISLAGNSANFRLYRDEGASQIELPVSATVTGGVLTLDPLSDLTSNKNYYVQIDSGALIDADGNGFAGLLGNNAYTFNTTADANAPTALSAKTTNAAGTYKAGDTITIEVSFSETVTVTGTPRLELNLGSGKFATHSGATSGTVLTFTYVVQAGDGAAELGFVDTADLASGIEDGSGNALDTAHISFSALDAAAMAGYGSDIAVDTSAPTALSWNVVAGATDVAHTSALVLTLSENISITDANAKLSVQANGGAATQIALSDPSITVSGSTLSWSGMAQNTAYDVTLIAGSLKDAGGNLLAASAATSFATAAVPASGDTIAPKVLDVSADTGAAAVTLGDGDPVRFIVTMSEHLKYIGNVMLNLQIGADLVPVYASGYSGSELYFDWNVEPGLQGANIEAVSISFDDAYLRDLADNNAVLTLPNAGGPGSLGYNTAISIDTAPVMTAAQPEDGDGYQPVGMNLSFTFSEAVFFGAGGAAAIKLYNSTGIPALVPTNVSIAGNVVTIDPTADLAVNQNYFVTIDANALVDDSGHAYEGTGVEGNIDFDTIVDNNAPTALEAHTTNNPGSYTTGQAISIVISFDETVTVTGTPTLTLNSGVARYAIHTGPATGSTLEFLYTIEAGDNAAELDFSSLASLASGITDLAGNALDLAHISFSALDSSGMPGYGSDIVIDTAAPLAQTFSPLDNAGVVALDANLTITFSETIVLGGAAGVRLYRIDGGSPVQVGIDASVSGNTLTIDPTANLTGGADYYVEIDNGAITDVHGYAYVGIVGSTDYNFTAGVAA